MQQFRRFLIQQHFGKTTKLSFLSQERDHSFKTVYSAIFPTLNSHHHCFILCPLSCLIKLDISQLPPLPGQYTRLEICNIFNSCSLL